MTTAPNKPSKSSRSLWPLCVSLIFIASLCGVVTGVGQSQSDVPQKASASEVAVQTESEGTVAIGDVISVNVFDTPELSGSFRVGEGGTIRAPLLGTIPVAGSDTLAIAQLIRQKLMDNHLVNDPEVNVSIIESQEGRRTVAVLGEVVKPGQTQSLSRKLWDLVAAAGGVTQFAGTRVVISQPDAKTPSSEYTVNWNHELGGQPNPEVASGDTVQVLRAGFIYVAGEVNRPGPLPITDEQVMLSQVITEAAGTKPTAKASHVQLVRNVDGNRTITEVDATSILKGRAPDIALLDGDLLYVPNSLAKVAITRGIELAIGLSSGFLLLKASR